MATADLCTSKPQIRKPFRGRLAWDWLGAAVATVPPEVGLLKQQMEQTMAKTAELQEGDGRFCNQKLSITFVSKARVSFFSGFDFFYVSNLKAVFFFSRFLAAQDANPKFWRINWTLSRKPTKSPFAQIRGSQDSNTGNTSRANWSTHPFSELGKHWTGENVSIFWLRGNMFTWKWLIWLTIPLWCWVMSRLTEQISLEQRAVPTHGEGIGGRCVFGAVFGAVIRATWKGLQNLASRRNRGW